LYEKVEIKQEMRWITENTDRSGRKEPRIGGVFEI